MKKALIKTEISYITTSRLIRCSGCERIIAKNTKAIKKTEHYPRTQNTSSCDWDSYFCKKCYPTQEEIKR